MSSVADVTCWLAVTAPRPQRDQCASLVPSATAGHSLPLPERHHGHQAALEMSRLHPCCQQEHRSEDTSRNKIIKSRLVYQPSFWISDLYLEQKESVPWRLKSLLALGDVVACEGCSGVGSVQPQAASMLRGVQLGSVLHMLPRFESWRPSSSCQTQLPGYQAHPFTLGLHPLLLPAGSWIFIWHEAAHLARSLSAVFPTF